MAQQQFNKIRTTLTLDIHVHEFFQKLAEQEDRSISWLINKTLIKHVENEQKEK